MGRMAKFQEEMAPTAPVGEARNPGPDDILEPTQSKSGAHFSQESRAPGLTARQQSDTESVNRDNEVTIPTMCRQLISNWLQEDALIVVGAKKSSCRDIVFRTRVLVMKNVPFMRDDIKSRVRGAEHFWASCQQVARHWTAPRWLPVGATHQS